MSDEPYVHELKLPAPIECDECDGDGWTLDVLDVEVMCPECNGIGSWMPPIPPSYTITEDPRG